MQKSALAIKISNPSSWVRTESVEVEIPVALSVPSPQIYDDHNCELTSQINTENHEKIRVKFVAEDIPANGYRIYYFKTRDRLADFHLPAEGLLDGNNFYLENDILRVVIEENGSLTVMERLQMAKVDPFRKNPIEIMGEELGAGSIWARDAFFNFRNLNIPYFDGKKIKSSKMYNQLELAGDFNGVLTLHREIEDGKIAIRSNISLQKGETPLIRIRNSIDNQTQNNSLFFQFAPQLKSLQYIKGKNSIIIWDKEQKHGMGIVSANLQYKLESTEKDHTSSEFLMLKVPNTNKMKIALVLLEPSLADSTLPNEEGFKRIAEEYLNHLSWEITNI